jgi:hypothetical protein
LRALALLKPALVCEHEGEREKRKDRVEMPVTRFQRITSGRRKETGLSANPRAVLSPDREFLSLVD